MNITAEKISFMPSTPLLASRWSRSTLAGSVLLLLGANLLAARTSEGPACQTARAYSRLVQRQRYDEIGSLFAADGVWFTPTGEVKRGPKEIGQAFVDYLGKRRPDFRTDNYVDGGRRCVMEVSMKVRVGADGRVMLGPDGSAVIIPLGSPEAGVFVRRAIDHFEVNARGKITRMIVYNAPTTYWR